MSSRYSENWAGFAIPVFSLLSLAVAVLESVNIRFLTILRDRPRSDYVDTANGILHYNPQKFQSNARTLAFIVAIGSTALFIYGAVITVHPRWRQGRREAWLAFVFFQTILAIFVIAIGAYLVDRVPSFSTSIEKLGAHDRIPYYGLMYYGGAAQIVYGFILVLHTIAAIYLDHIENTPTPPTLSRPQP